MKKIDLEYIKNTIEWLDEHTVLIDNNRANCEILYNSVQNSLQVLETALGKKSDKLDFGDYGIIEQKRYGVENEQYSHKVIGRCRSNTWVDVPVQTPARETIHGHMEDVIYCVCCGVDEREILKYRASDVKTNGA